MTFMVQWTYTSEAWAAMVKNPEDRSAPVKALMEKSGGRLLGMYYSFGEYDGIAIVEAPDETTCMADLLAVVAPGHLNTIKTSILLTMEQGMEAMSKAGALAYPAPKG